MNIPYITNANGWTFFVKGRPVVVKPTDMRYNEIVTAALSNKEDKLLDLLSISDDVYIVNQIINEFDGLTFMSIERSDNSNVLSVTYKGQTLPTVLSDKLLKLWREGCTDFTHYFKFIEKLLQIKSDRTREELYKFLEAGLLPITQDGNFIAYKGVQYDMYSNHGNNDTIVLQGHVNSNGQILNTVGSVIEVDIKSVDSDCNNYCSYGLHVGSYDYASAFESVVVAVEVDPMDVVSVPMDFGCKKCRVTKYKVLNIVESTYKTADVIVDNDTYAVKETENVTRECRDANVETLLSFDNISNTRATIDRNIKNHRVNSDGNYAKAVEVTPSNCSQKPETTIAQLCSSVGRKLGVTRASMLAILLRLGYNVEVNNSAIGLSIVSF